MEERMLYLECYSGISGDMTVAALLDLGAREEKLREALEALDVGGYEVHIGRTAKCGIRACNFEVALEEKNCGEYARAHGNEECGHGNEWNGHGNEGNGHGNEVYGHDNDEHVYSNDEYEHSNEEYGCNNERHGHSYEGHDPSHEEHNHTHDGQSHHRHEHRSYRDICEILEKAPLEPQVRTLAEKMFFIVAQAEAKVHGKPLDEVHFHEVGAVDSIVDIVGAAACFVDLGIREVCVSTLYEGTGMTWCQHGKIPVPAPAVAEIVSAAGLPVRITENQGEMVTPTGAAIAAALRTRETLPAAFTVEKIGVGAGKKDFRHANILRAMMIRPAWQNGEGSGRTATAGAARFAAAQAIQDTADLMSEQAIQDAADLMSEQAIQDAANLMAAQAIQDTANQMAAQAHRDRAAHPMVDEIYVLETNIDDCSGEQLAFAIECLMEAGARDASCFPIYMKKNRPAWMLQVLCDEENISEMEKVIFRETTSIGLRRYKESRSILPRSMAKIETELGMARIKVCEHKGQWFYYPEYSTIRDICRKTGKSYREVYEYLSGEAAAQLNRR